MTIATVGGVLITASGLLNVVLGARIGALLYEAYPGGRMGQVLSLSQALQLVGRRAAASCLRQGQR